MFVSDSPIRSRDEDKLRRTRFADTLGPAFADYRGEDSLVLGLYGPWGSGKTSVIDMVVEGFECLTRDERPTILRFNPWNYSDQDQLISQFFNEHSHTLNRSDTSRDAANAAALINTYANCLYPLKFIPLVGAGADMVRQIGQTVASGLEAQAQQTEKDLAAIKTELDDLFRSSKTKVIIVIDDIDRLNNTEIRQTFQLVKSSADFENTVLRSRF